MSRREQLLDASFRFAEAMIRGKIDGEGKFVSAAVYELAGESLKHYLAFAYREGTKYGTSKNSPKGRSRGFSLVEKPGRPAKSSRREGPSGGQPIGRGLGRLRRRLSDQGEKFYNEIDSK